MAKAKQPVDLRLKRPKTYPVETHTVQLPGEAAREFRAYLACYADKGQAWEPSEMLATMILAFVKTDKVYRKWKHEKGPEKLDALLYPEPPKKPPVGLVPNGIEASK
jgi:hypothetical protein